MSEPRLCLTLNPLWLIRSACNNIERRPLENVIAANLDSIRGCVIEIARVINAELPEGWKVEEWAVEGKPCPPPAEPIPPLDPWVSHVDMTLRNLAERVKALESWPRTIVT